MTEPRHDSDADTSPPSAPARVKALGIARAVLVPLALATLATGLLQAFGTPWGLLRHGWVVVTLGLTLLSTAVLLAYTSTLGALAEAARDPGGHLGLLPSASPVLHASAALVVLVAAAALSVFRPRGLTRYGWGRQQAARAGR